MIVGHGIDLCGVERIRRMVADHGDHFLGRTYTEAEIAYATLALVTDYDAWKTGESAVTIEMVVANLRKNTATAQRLLARALPRIPAVPDCSCHHALQYALLTERKLWPARVCRQLRPLLKNYLQ